MPRRSPFSPEFRERAIRSVLDQALQRGSQWAAIRSIAEKVGCHKETLRNRVRAHDRNAGVRPGPPTERTVRFIDAHRVVYGVEPICAVLPNAPSPCYEAKARERGPARLPARAGATGHGRRGRNRAARAAWWRAAR